MSWHCLAGDGSIELFVYAQPQARKSAVAGLRDGALKIRVAAPAIDEKANQELIRFLADAFKVGRRDVVFLQGDRSRHKRFSIRGSRIDPELLLQPADQAR